MPKDGEAAVIPDIAGVPEDQPITYQSQSGEEYSANSVMEAIQGCDWLRTMPVEEAVVLVQLEIAGREMMAEEAQAAEAAEAARAGSRNSEPEPAALEVATKKTAELPPDPILRREITITDIDAQRAALETRILLEEPEPEPEIAIVGLPERPVAVTEDRAHVRAAVAPDGALSRNQVVVKLEREVPAEIIAEPVVAATISLPPIVRSPENHVPINAIESVLPPEPEAEAPRVFDVAAQTPRPLPDREPEPAVFAEVLFAHDQEPAPPAAPPSHAEADADTLYDAIADSLIAARLLYAAEQPDAASPDTTNPEDAALYSFDPDVLDEEAAFEPEALEGLEHMFAADAAEPTGQAEWLSDGEPDEETAALTPVLRAVLPEAVQTGIAEYETTEPDPEAVVVMQELLVSIEQATIKLETLLTSDQSEAEAAVIEEEIVTLYYELLERIGITDPAEKQAATQQLLQQIHEKATAEAPEIEQRFIENREMLVHTNAASSLTHSLSQMAHRLRQYTVGKFALAMLQA